MGWQAGDYVHMFAFTDKKYYQNTAKKNYQLFIFKNHESFFDGATPIPFYFNFHYPSAMAYYLSTWIYSGYRLSIHNCLLTAGEILLISDPLTGGYIFVTL